jgi:butyrate kinase
VINPGSTSTKTAVYRGERRLEQQTVRHSARSLRRFRRLTDQVPMREAAVLDTLARAGIEPGALDAVVARGGLLAPCPSGTYRVGPAMLEELRRGRHGEHASNLGAILAARIADAASVPAFIVDPVVVDELRPEARVSGIPQIRRRSVWHALNQKAVARRVAADLGLQYEEANLIVAHLGGGTSVAAHARGKAVDVNNALDGDGPFAVERSGGLPAGDLVRLACKARKADLLRQITGAGGVVAYLDTNDLREVARRAVAGDAAAREVLAAMAYQVAKEIGACAAVLSGKVDAVVLTGAAAGCKPLVRRIRRRVRFLGPVRVVAGAMEMDALAAGALRVLSGEARARTYRG